MSNIFFILLAIAIGISATTLYILFRFVRQQRTADLLLSAFRDVADEFNLSITRYQLLANRVFGFDAAKRRLLFLEVSGNDQNGYLVDLDEVRYVEVKKVYDLVRNERIDNLDNLRLIALQIEYYNGAKPLQLPFYIKTIDPVTDVKSHLEQAYDWQEMLSSAKRRTRKARLNSTGAFMTPGTRFLIRSQYTAGQLN